jgi:hypothetical protein
VLDSGGDTASGAPLLVDSLEVGLVTQAVESPFLAWAPLPIAGTAQDERPTSFPFLGA